MTRSKHVRNPDSVQFLESFVFLCSFAVLNRVAHTTRLSRSSVHSGSGPVTFILLTRGRSFERLPTRYSELIVTNGETRREKEGRRLGSSEIPGTRNRINSPRDCAAIRPRQSVHLVCSPPQPASIVEFASGVVHSRSDNSANFCKISPLRRKPGDEMKFSGNY